MADSALPRSVVPAHTHQIGSLPDIAAALALKVDRAGDTMSGALTVPGLTDTALAGAGSRYVVADATGALGIGTTPLTEYIHTQSVSSATWVIVHNLGRYPSVTVTDSAGTSGVPQFKYDSANQITVTLSAAMTGFAYLN